jgi:hypothetical protein
VKFLNVRPQDDSIHALLRASEPRPQPWVRSGSERPSPLRPVDYFLLGFMGAAGFMLGRHTRIGAPS